VNLKCDPALALELWSRYPSVPPGYPANKRHRNTVELDGDIEDGELRWLIDHSYELVVANLPSAVLGRFPNS
jgi:predicted DNA-binding protein (MmcQ/YjbR family)